MLSFEKGRPIARVVGGQYNKKILHIYDPDLDESTKKKKADVIPFDDDLLNELVFKNLKGRDSATLLQIESALDHLEQNTKPSDSKVLELFARSKKVKNDRTGKELLLHDGILVPIPDPNKRSCLYVAGQSGAGKSTYIAKYLTEYKRINPEKNIILFSRKDEDDVLDKLDPIRIEINEELYEEPINPNEELADSIVVFDDTDTIPDAKIKKAINGLKDDILQIGRSENIDSIITAHNITNYKESRTILQESTAVTFFPKAGITKQLKYYLNNYIGMNNKQAERVLNLPSRWVTIFQTAPTCVMYQTGAYLLNS
jgi:molybdopterin converting factor small subunit